MHPCLCCGYRTLPDPPPGTYALCPVCFWEDDGFQAANVHEAGANSVSLAAARANYATHGACDETAVAHVRPPTAADGPRVIHPPL